MKVFISYASDSRGRAEKLAAQLGGRQHDVFFDRDSLRVGKEFHARIKSEAEACDLFVFLISAASVTPGHYSLTELGYVEKRWPNPSGRVLPVLVDDTELAVIPPYLGESLNVLRTRGAFAVEVCNAVEALAAELAASRDESDASEPTANGPQSGLATLVDTLTKKLSERRKLGSDEQGSTLTLQIDNLVTDIKALFAPNQGAVIAGAKLIKVVGVGNFGTVWEAERVDNGKRVAVKVFRLERLAEGQMLARFRRSIRAMRLLSERKRLLAKKDTRARVVGFVSEDFSSLAFSMELLTGGNVEDVGRLGWTLERKLQVALDVCAAVAYSHDNGVIHRDIKPANIVLNEHRQPVLTDFDIADVRWATSLSTTVEGGLGTPVFAAPEQLEDADTATERADVYSLGRFLQYLLLERSPGYQIERDPSLSNLSAFPPAVVEIIRRATQYAPERRFSSVANMMVQLEGCRSGAAAFRARLARGWRWSRNNWPAFAIVTCLVLGSVGLAAYQGEIAAEQKTLRLEAEKHRLLAEERNRQLEEAQAKLSALSEELEQIRKKERNFTKRRAQLQQTLDALHDEARLMKSDDTRRQLERRAPRREGSWPRWIKSWASWGESRQS